MLDKLKRYFSTQKPPEYSLVQYSFFRDHDVAQEIYEKGYYIADFIGEDERRQLLATYEKYYKNKEQNDGAFFGEISKIIHNTLNDILNDTLDKWFINYKNMVSAFVVKTPGASGRVPIHQDSASVDEKMFSNINIWIPLQSVNAINGALHVIPRSHHIFTPYRAATIDPLTLNIEEELAPYFIPLYLQAGQALIFDSRMFHFSPANMSIEKRVISICKVCSKDADVIAYFKEKEDTLIEKWICPDDHLHYGENHNDTIRPQKSRLSERISVKIKPLTMSDFENRVSALGIAPQIVSADASL